MTITESNKILGNRARWEVLQMKKALSLCELLNTEEENKRLEACKIYLKHNKK